MVPSKTSYSKVSKNVEIIDSLYNNQFCLRRGQIPCSKGYSLCFTISDICVYRLNKQGKLIPCFTGEHMQQCEEYECNNKFKCPGYYCIPFSYNCDGKWDCPGGHDEYSEICLKERQSINMFHCKSSQICIHVIDVCDQELDCPFGDDEIVCDLSKTQCPIQCICCKLSIQCIKVPFIKNVFLKKYPYTSIWISQTGVSSLWFVQFFDRAIYLYLNYNKLKIVCGVLSNNDSLILLDCNSNGVSNLQQFCFKNLRATENINLRKNIIHFIHKEAFWKMPNLKVLSLAENLLNSLEIAIIQNVSSLVIFANPLHHLQFQLFINTKLYLVETDDYHVCCITPPSTLCNAFKPLYISCSTLLSTAAMRILLTVVFCTIFSLNIMSIDIQLTSKSKSSFKTVIIFINISDLLCGSYLVVLLFADFVFQEDFAVKETMWRSSFPCFMIFVISLIFSFLSATYLSFMSLCRTILVIVSFWQFCTKLLILHCLQTYVYHSLIPQIPLSSLKY